MSEIVERLQGGCQWCCPCSDCNALMNDAADEIARLTQRLVASEAERDRMKVVGDMIMGAICGSTGPLAYAAVNEAFDELEQRLAAAEAQNKQLVETVAFQNKAWKEDIGRLAAAHGLLMECIVGVGPERFPHWLDESRHALGMSEQEHVTAVWEANQAARAAGGE